MTPALLFRRQAVDKTPFLDGKLVLFRLDSDRSRTWKCRIQIGAGTGAVFLDTRSPHLPQARSIAIQLSGTLDGIVATVGIEKMRSHPHFEEIERNFSFDGAGAASAPVRSEPAKSAPDREDAARPAAVSGYLTDKLAGLTRRRNTDPPAAERTEEAPEVAPAIAIAIAPEVVEAEDPPVVPRRPFWTSTTSALGVLIAVCALFITGTILLKDIFAASLALNALILAVFLVGCIGEFRRWADAPADPSAEEEVLRAGEDGTFYAASTASVLDDAFRSSYSTAREELTSLLLASTRRRINMSRSFGTYCCASLVMLGLFGTFLGLMSSVNNIQFLLDALSPARDVSVLFESTQSIIFSSLGSMSVAFSTTFFGLTGSIMLGFLGRAVSLQQEKAYKDLELRLSDTGPQREGPNTSELDRLIEAAPSLRNFRTLTSQADSARASLLRHVEAVVKNAVAERRKQMARLMADTDGIQDVFAGALNAADRASARGRSGAPGATTSTVVAPPARAGLLGRLLKT